MFEAHAPSAVDSLSVGQLLRQLRQQARLSQLELALQAGMSQRHLSCVETGRAQPSPELLHSVLSTLVQRKGMRIWTEMFSDGVLELQKRGALDEDIPVTASFIFGGEELYKWLHLNRQVRMLRTEKTNDPGQIARQGKNDQHQLGAAD